MGAGCRDRVHRKGLGLWVSDASFSSLRKLTPHPLPG